MLRRLPLLLTLLASGCFQVSLVFDCANNEQCVFRGQKGVCTTAHVCDFDGAQADLAGVDFSGVDFSSQPDLASVDLVGADFAGLDLAGLDLAKPACALPQLLVTVEKLGAFAPGKILRYSLATGMPQACTSLNGSGALGQFPEAAAKVGNDIAVAARDGVFLIDPASDLVKASWTNNPQALFPIDVVPLMTADGQEIAVAWAMVGSTQWLWQLDLFWPSMPSAVHHSWSASTIGLGSVIGVTIDPWDATKLMVLDDYQSSTPQAEEYADPFVPAVTAHMAEPGGIGFHSIASISSGGVERTVWTARNVYNGFYALGAASPSPPPTVPSFGPGQCSCDMLHAVPDPSDAKTAFGLCDGATTRSRVVHRAVFSTTTSSATCTPVVDGMSLGADDRITHLAIAMP